MDNYLDEMERKVVDLENSPSEYAKEDMSVGVDIPNVSDIRKAARYAVQDVELSIDRIGGVVRMGGRIVRAAEDTRKELYERFTNQYQFEDLGPVNDPKSLIRDFTH
mmetsp:Transcript_25324/g.58487  ORF Transcript_25324/g.58487 Transcript_25324/m.58487 type:complete len:107 (-) Transcript_25324:392-712(-)